MGAAWGQGAERGKPLHFCVSLVLCGNYYTSTTHESDTTFAQYLEGLALEGCRFPHNSNEVPTGTIAIIKEQKELCEGSL